MNSVASPAVNKIKTSRTARGAWTAGELWIFRITFIYFLLQCLPLDWNYYKHLFSLHVTAFQYWFGLSKYFPQFIAADAIAKWDIASFANWFIALAIAVAGAVVWHYWNRTQKNYDHLYYGLRVVLRYRLAVGVIGYGLIKLFALQFPQPALSDLHTPYGDFLPWKIYYLTTGFGKAGYQQLIGFVEITSGLLLLYRRTASLGAALALLLLANILAANFAYELGNHVYAAYLLVLAAAILWYDVPRLFSLVVKNKFTVAASYQTYPGGKRYQQWRRYLKSGLIVFFLLSGATALYSAAGDRWPYPGVPGLAGAEGFYNVKEYRINGNSLPYSLVDAVRWQNVVFEKWNSISVRKGVSAPLDPAIPAVSDDTQRPYEWEGNGGRYYYRYTVDSAHHQIRLVSPHAKEPEVYDYTLADNNTIRLSGKTGAGGVDIVLEKLPDTQLLIEGRRNTKKKF